jgi:uncharacterized protein YyaL (SSP411 family)
VADGVSERPASRPTNRLANESSPYLLQHAHNPVDWHPWGDAAFALARDTQRPIFLSIGYSTCHWCHVMEHESFEDAAIAAALNAGFVPIKVDREERPDVDRVYMAALQSMGLGGGWPLTAFLTPELAPFYGGTYFPPVARGGMPGLPDVLARVVEAWANERAALEADGAHVLAALTARARADAAAEAAPLAMLVDDAFASLARAADPEWGGFGRAPKFPTAANLAFLHRVAAQERVAGDAARADEALRLATHQLARMREGGIHDHLGGGFHRYSVDRQWLVPHFEKMLYDQAQLATSYLDAFAATGHAPLADAARGIFAYVMRDLDDPAGGFCAAEDADSEGREGAFYAWTPADLARLLGTAGAERFARRYGVTADGNFEPGESVLAETAPLATLATEFGASEADLAREFADARAKLFAARAERPRPSRDDKVLTAWNGLMIGALAHGAVGLDDAALAARAARAAAFAQETLYDAATGALARYARGGVAHGAGQLDDYANLCVGLLDLYRATFDAEWLAFALALAEGMIARFADAEEGGFFESPAGDASVRARLKSDFDGAETAGNSQAALALVRLAAWTDRADLGAQAAATLAAFGRRLAAHPVAMPLLLVAGIESLAPPRHVVIVAHGDDPASRAATARLVAVARRTAQATDALFVTVVGEAHSRLARLAPFVATLVPAQNAPGATAYVCERYTCRAPVTREEDLVAALSALPATPLP